MNLFDLVLVVIILLTAGFGYKLGGIKTIFFLLKLLIPVGVGILFYASLADLIGGYFIIQKQWQYPLPFLLLFFVTYFIVTFTLLLINKKIPVQVHAGLPNRLAGIIPGSLIGLVVIFFLTNLSKISLSANVAKNAKESYAGAVFPDSNVWVNNNLSGIFNATQDLKVQVAHEDQSEFKADIFYSRPELETAMLELINIERKKVGAKLLVADEKMRSVALLHGTDMFTRGYFSHDTPEGADPFVRMKKNGISFFHAGENLAHSPDLIAAHKGLMESPGHKANILNPHFGRVGISILDGGPSGLMLVQEFKD